MTTGKPTGGVRAVTLTVRFLVELGLLAALAYWGFVVGDGAAAFVLGIGAPLLAAVVWGMFVAPKARRPVSVPVRLVIEVVLFIAGAAALAAAAARCSGSRSAPCPWRRRPSTRRRRASGTRRAPERATTGQRTSPSTSSVSLSP